MSSSHCHPECGIDPCNNPPPVDAANETLESTVNNFITEFFGTVTKSVVDNRVVWSLPCDLDTGLPGFPRTPNVGLACYFLDLFVDLAAQVASGGILPELSVRQATTANITLSGEQTIDGVLTSASRILVKNQTLTKNNGIYVTGAGAWTRATDADIAAELQVKNYYFVTNGTTQGGTGWTITTAPVVLGTDPVLFTQFNALSSYTAGSGLSLAGTVFSLDTSIAMLRSANLSDLANKVTAQINLLPSQLGHAGEALITDGTNVAWGPVATADSTARSKADSAATVASAATSQNVAQSSLISTNIVAVSTADSKAVAASAADSSNLATSNSQNTSQSLLISVATSAAAVADSKAASNSVLISAATVNISVADSKAVSDSVIISSNLATTGSQNTSQSTLISTADSKAVSVASAGALDSVARSQATSVATVEATDFSASNSKDTSQSVLISTATAAASTADSKAVSDSVVISSNLATTGSQNASQSLLISVATSKADSATSTGIDSVARSQATSVATTESTDNSASVSRDLSQSTLISVADSKGTSAAGNSNDSVARSQATSVATTESSDNSASNSKDVSQSVLISVATINASAADSKAVSVSLVVSSNLATANSQDSTQSTNISATDSRATSAAALDASANTSQSLLISTATLAAATADSKAVSDSVLISSNLATGNSQNTSQSVLISTATTNASVADSKAVSDSVVISSNLATGNSQNTSQSVLISTATAAASTADSKAVSDSVGMSSTESKAVSLSTGFSSANSQALVDSSTISGGTSSLTSSDTSQSVLISTADSKATSAAGNSNDSTARSMATSGVTLGSSQNTSQSTLISTATTNASTADSKAVVVSAADSTNLVLSNSQNSSQSLLISAASSAAAVADSKALSDSVVISSNLQIGNSQNTSQSTLVSTADSKAVSTALRLSGALGRVINVKDYGATGDGVTNDTTALSNAFAAMTSYSSLYIPAGKYLTSGVSVPSSLTNITVFGDGASSIIFQNTPANTTMYVDRTVTFATLRDFVLDGAATSRLNGCGLRCDATDLVVDNVMSARCSDFAFFFGQHNNATPSKRIQVIGCKAQLSKGDGFHFDNVDGVQVVGSLADRVGDDAFACVGYESFAGQVLNVSFTGCRAVSDGTVGFRGMALLMVKGVTVSDFKATNMIGAGIEIGDDANNAGVFNEDIVIRNADLVNCIITAGPYGAFGIYFAKRVNLQNVTVTDPATGSCIGIGDFDDLTLSNCNLLVTRSGFCRGIIFNSNTTFNSRTFRTTWTNLFINGINYDLKASDNNETVYLLPHSSMTINNASVTNVTGSQVNTAAYIAADRTGATWKIGNNVNTQGRTVFTTDSPTAVTKFNNN